jgi:hypothetical protein
MFVEIDRETSGLRPRQDAYVHHVPQYTSGFHESMCGAVLSGRGDELIDLAKGNLFREDGEQSVSSDKEKKEWRLVCKPQSM